MMNDAPFKIFTDGLNQRFVEMGNKIDQSETRLTNMIGKRPSKDYMWLICGSLTVIAFIAGMAELHWDMAANAFHLG